ncbi:MAG: beta-ketoacyl-[acyl-carrier-protein] synthase II [Rickettsiales bacterium]|nr:beta-ketoacyl-[acyl-carrier-protein] synthase II [Rickettsiales bacterium]|tara:strand:- start:5800 stop:7053 length:1254 start_codon:yes stop_codon:yes gene_type:complete
MRRVVVTGIGMCTPLGYGVDLNWKKLIKAKSGIRKLEGFEIDDLTSKIGGQVPLEGDSKLFPESVLSSKDRRKIEPFIEFAMISAKEAIEDSGWLPNSEKDSERAGVMVGSGIGGLDGIRMSSDNLRRSPRKISPFFIPSCLINLASGHISIKYNLKGPNHSVVTACASGAHAIGDSFRIISYGDADVMIAGGTEAACTRFGISGFCAMRALSTKFNDDPEKASRPWDKDRDGFVLSEGSGMLVLEELEHAKKRSAKIYAEVVGYGLTGDAFHPTAPASDGGGGLRAMKMALNNAKISSDQIDYINAHGTSTPLGDEIEFNAVKKIFENNKKNLYMSSTKSSTGHLLGASGAIESIFSILSLTNGVIPPTLNLTNPSSDCEGINLVPKESITNENNFSLSNSFGFGGTNVSLIFKKK